MRGYTGRCRRRVGEAFCIQVNRPNQPTTEENDREDEFIDDDEPTTSRRVLQLYVHCALTICHHPFRQDEEAKCNSSEEDKVLGER